MRMIHWKSVISVVRLLITMRVPLEGLLRFCVSLSQFLHFFFLSPFYFRCITIVVRFPWIIRFTRGLLIRFDGSEIYVCPMATHLHSLVYGSWNAPRSLCCGHALYPSPVLYIYYRSVERCNDNVGKRAYSRFYLEVPVASVHTFTA